MRHLWRIISPETRVKATHEKSSPTEKSSRKTKFMDLWGKWTYSFLAIYFMGNICHTLQNCGKAFKTQYSLKYHINGTHVEAVEKNYSCNFDSCDFKCRLARYLVSHTLKHTGEKAHRCDECGNTFGFHGSLMRHILAVHKNEKRHKVFHHKNIVVCELMLTFHSTYLQCLICDRNFKTTLALKEHSNVHTGKDPNECSQCPSRYRYKSSLRRHIAKCHRGVEKSEDR